MTERKFIWLAESCYPRRGPKLVQGEEHSAAQYPAETVEEWIRAGAAAWMTADGESASDELTPEAETHRSYRGRSKGRGKE